MFLPVTLETNLISLQPMRQEHLHGFYQAGNFDVLWQHMPKNHCQNLTTTKTWVNEALKAMAQGEQLAFVTIDKVNNRLVGSTRMIRLDTAHRKLEIGYTFITPNYQRSYVNSHAKFLMLQYAFEQLNIARVEICTHEHNQQSRTAIARIGGQFEGILRKHRCFDGKFRNTALFSITDDEWPGVKQQLLTTAKQPEEFTCVSR